MAIGTPTTLATGTFGNTSSASISLTLSTGDLLIVVFNFNGSRLLNSIAWNSINLTQDIVTAASSGLKTSVCSLYVTSGATANLAISLNGTARGGIIPIKVTGMLSAAWTDQVQSNGQLATTAPTSNATPTTTQAAELVIGAIGNTTNTLGGSWSNAFTDLTSVADSASADIDAGYLIVSAAGAQTAAKTGCTSSNYASAVVTYKGAAATSVQGWMPPIEQPYFDRKGVVSY